MKSILPFAGAFVLNLPEAAQRRARVKRMLRQHHIPFEFMPAERAQHPDPKQAAILGCLHTHAKCVRAAQNLAWKTVLIIEDDAVLHPRFYQLLPDLSALEHLPWDVFYFYHIRDNDPIQPLRQPVEIIKVEYSIWSHFYAVHHSFYDEFLKCAAASNWYSDRLFRGQPYRLHGLNANLVGQDAGRSSIDGGYQARIHGLSF